MKVIQDWTVNRARYGEHSPGDLEYRVIRVEDTHRQEIRTTDGACIGVMDLPNGMLLERQSYEVMLQFALSQVGA